MFRVLTFPSFRAQGPNIPLGLGQVRCGNIPSGQKEGHRKCDPAPGDRRDVRGAFWLLLNVLKSLCLSPASSYKHLAVNKWALSPTVATKQAAEFRKQLRSQWCSQSPALAHLRFQSSCQSQEADCLLRSVGSSNALEMWTGMWGE